MTPTEPTALAAPRKPVESLRDGDPLERAVFMAIEKQLKVNRNGVPFVQLDLRDRTGTLPARLFNAGEAQFASFANGDYLLVDGKVQNFQGSLQAVLTRFEKADAAGIDPAEYRSTPGTPVAQLEARLRQFLLSLSDPPLRAIAEVVLMDAPLMAGIMACPAGVKLHHATTGGLLEHVVTMMEGVDRLAPLYPGVGRDLCVLGVFLHDLGKVRELTYDRAFGYSDEGQLVGHIALGLELLNAKLPQAAELLGEPPPRELVLRLKHLILSHHGSLEHGSPKVPMTPEAMLVHAVDWLDTRMHMVLRDIREDRAGTSAWTPYNGTLQRRFYKGGAPGESPGERPESYD